MKHDKIDDIPSPIGQPCEGCGQTIKKGEGGVMDAEFVFFHLSCGEDNPEKPEQKIQFPTRMYSAFHELGINKPEDLDGLPVSKVKSAGNIGPKTLVLLRNYLAANGMSLTEGAAND